MPDSAGYRFGPFHLQPAQRRLAGADGQPLKLGGRAFDMLVALVERRERTVGKDELLDLVWPRRVVEENNLQVQVVALRRLLGADAIATVPGRGYRFTLPTDVEGAAALPPPAPPPPPAAAPALFGRDADLQVLVGMLQAHALVTVAGSGGIGKTRLARAALAQAQGATAWVDLAPIADPAAVPAAVARALGVTAAPDALDAAVGVLQAAPHLLALDNAEHVLAAVATLAQALLQRVPALRLLVTSQEVLRLPQEQVLRLAPLALPAAPGLAAAAASGAVALFTARAQGADRRFLLDEQNLPRGDRCLPAPGRHPAGDRAGRGAHAAAGRARPAGAAGRALPPAHGRRARCTAAPADAAGHAGVEPRAAGRRRTSAAAAAGRLRRRLHAGRRPAAGCR